MSVVILFVTSESSNSERRFDKALTISQLKIKLEPITGIPAESQRLSLYNGEALIGSLEGNDEIMLGAYPVENYMTLQVNDTNPNRIKNQYTDLSLVEKYELPQEEYEKRSDSVLAFKQRNKLGRFSDSRSASEADSNVEYEELAVNIHVGDRCEVEIGSGELKRRGTVRFVGETKFKSGIWVGVQYDEPLGKNDGSVEGERYFECPSNYGAFVRPNKVVVGDFPEEDFDDLSDLEEM
ncbi:hypothetical protein K493DRAFT_202972 [Basidiobolus meristosporus CBS 931.73]|uniref:CAP-Gly domain-containing protein n=1 Tax=Basidiobolus meristosporus CBS 931.73 TaxID=1314790 RepID=A0A1Y1Z8Y6_9FUNG|nr:hypothetical protein K493DRAFT_202972 [Basidiobolus meristosporus CBS 931.73]|eukprot:ORY06732.1 hypothetical protein K493DRAFT_202972 [Basidiobolus meristosporus CBS 931.73]